MDNFLKWLIMYKAMKNLTPFFIALYIFNRSLFLEPFLVSYTTDFYFLVHKS